MLDTMIPRRKVWQLGVATAGLGLWPSGRAAAQDAAITFWNPGLFPMVDPIDKAKRPEDLLHLPGDRTIPGGEPGSYGPDGDPSRRH